MGILILIFGIALFAGSFLLSNKATNYVTLALGVIVALSGLFMVVDRDRGGSFVSAGELAGQEGFVSAADVATSSHQTSQQSEATMVTVRAANYEIVTTEDNSMKALVGPLSSYTVQELEALPVNKKISLSAALTGPITQEQIEPTLRKIVNEVTARDGDTDELMVFLYSDAARVGQSYDIGRAIWAPGGEFGNVTPDIARSNDRSSYSITIDAEPNIEEYLAQRASSESRFGLAEEQRRALYREIVAAEIRGLEEADQQISPSEDVMANIELADKLQAQYTQVVRDKYGVSKEQMNKISVEAIQEGWAY